MRVLFWNRNHCDSINGNGKKFIEMRKKLTDSEKKYLIENYPNTPTYKLAEKLKITVEQAYRFSYGLKLKKSEEFQNTPMSGRLRPGTNIGGNTRFKKGAIPHNKGKEMKPETYAKCARTMFKKGIKPHNTHEIGTILKRKDKSFIPYYHIKIDEGKWEMLHRLIWQLHNGEIPEKMKITFIDGNSLNCSIENLEMVSCADLMRKNSHINIPKDILEVIKLKNKLIKKINSYGKK